MVAESLEQRVKNMEEANKKLQHEIERAQAVNEIQNVISKVQYLHTANRNSEVSALFAKKVPDIRLYWGEQGYWEGQDGPRKAAAIFEMGGVQANVGMMALHLMANPVIVVAGDGKTAKGVWVACGLVAGKDRKTGKPRASWEWNRYGIDFIKEDSKWKLWHHHVFPLFKCGWDEKWEEQFKKEGFAMQMPDDLKPDHPATIGDVPYSPDTELPFIPVPPEPYETFDPKTAY